MVQDAITGLLSGGVYASLGVCLVVLYRMVGVLNVAQAAFGAFGAFVASAAFSHSLAVPFALLLGMLAGAGVGLICGGVMSTWFSDSSLEVRSSVSIGMLIVVMTAGFRLFGTSPRAFPQVVPEGSISVAGVNVTNAAMASILGSIVIATGVWALLRFTDLGLQMRAMSERASTAELLGVRARRISVAAWVAMGAVSTLAVLTITASRDASFQTLSLLVVPGLAAGLIGAFRRLSWTVAGGLGIGLVEGICTHLSVTAPYRDVVPFVIIVLALVWARRREAWDEAR